MSLAKISIIAAVGKNRELGKDNKLLWHIPNDLKRFKKLTSGHPVIMGQKTFDSIGKPLPNRVNIVLSKEPNLNIDGCVITNSIDDAIAKAREVECEEIFIIGGGSIYAQTIDLADKLYLTEVDGEFGADTFFPDYSKFTKKIFEQSEEADGFKYTFLELLK